MIVVACNTATVLAIEALRARWPRLVFVGGALGVEPAAARSQTRRIAVMARAAAAEGSAIPVAQSMDVISVPSDSRVPASTKGSWVHPSTAASTFVARIASEYGFGTSSSAEPCTTQSMLAVCPGLDRITVEVLTIIASTLPG